MQVALNGLGHRHTNVDVCVTHKHIFQSRPIYMLHRTFQSLERIHITYSLVFCILNMRLHNAHISSSNADLERACRFSSVEYKLPQCISMENTVLWLNVRMRWYFSLTIFFFLVFGVSCCRRTQHTNWDSFGSLLQFVCTAKLPHLAAASPLPLVLAVRNSKVSNSFPNEQQN